MKIATIALTLLVTGLALPATAQDDSTPDARTTPAFACTAETEGQLTCQANRRCECVHKAADKGRGLPARWAWDCGILRGACEVTPADLNENATALPPVIVEHDPDDDEDED